ncbi:MAG TPA: BON domain-containing protein [Candidatus Baltobacteraceae bacterium]|nr:BON domain-containing protein [Candidatus Baltobacteraceae bacterium]
MKTDLMLQEDVADELAFDPSVDSSNIGVAAKDGIVTLTGRVDTYAEKIAAEKAAKRVAGVKAIASEIDVEIAAFRKRDDTEIAAAAVNVLDWDTMIPADKIKVKVEHGWLTLDGQVPWQYQKDAAERAVSNLVGVRGVSNLILVAPTVRSSEVAEKIRKAFERTADLDANRLTVDASDGTVTLRGHVRSWAEHDEAGRAAFAVSGVSRVDNLTTVGA